MKNYELRLEPSNDRLWKIFLEGDAAVGSCTRLMTGYLVEPNGGAPIKRFRRSDALKDAFGDEANFSIEEPADLKKEDGFA